MAKILARLRETAYRLAKAMSEIGRCIGLT